jgi:hypothetical protein
MKWTRQNQSADAVGRVSAAAMTGTAAHQHSLVRDGRPTRAATAGETAWLQSNWGAAESGERDADVGGH